VDSLGRNALHYCAFNGNKPLAEVLLRIEGIDVNAKASNGDTALHLAATHASHGSGDVIALLLASNADFAMADGQEWSALELAVFNRRLTPALMLIEAGASISFRQ
jgi:ankyrin repeat protein